MPSLLVGGQSGGQLLFSGNPWSGNTHFQPGQTSFPAGGIQLRYGPAAGPYSGNSLGNLYVSLSGNMTIGSGMLVASGGPNSGLLDGMPMAAGDSYWIPRLAAGTTSGSIVASGINSGAVVLNVWATTDLGNSGVARLWFEIY